MSASDQAYFDEMDRRDRERVKREARAPRKRYGLPSFWREGGPYDRPTVQKPDTDDTPPEAAT